MALHLLVDRGALDWDMPIADRWPGFARAGKGAITVGMLAGHRAGLPWLDAPLTLGDFCDPARAGLVRAALEAQVPAWAPGCRQGYHALTYGMYSSEIFARVAGESVGSFLRRELFDPLGSDTRLGTPPEFDADCAALYPPSDGQRVARMLAALVTAPRSTEGRLARAMLAPRSFARRAFLNPSPGPRGLAAYAEPAARRVELAWAGATASADGIARAYLPFAGGGAHGGRRYLAERTLAPAYERLGWSERDLVLQKPLGWSHGFLKEEPHVFSPTRESFGHPGIGGALGWCDPVAGLAWGYVTNRLDWRVRSPRAIALCRALYACEPVRDALASAGR
jgi:CubicO group peptidase (beta-lactamase class C family)